MLGDVESLVRDHTGDALALGATALGFPEFAPIGKLAGPIVGSAINEGIELAGKGLDAVGGAVEEGLGAVGGFIGGLFGGDDGELVPNMAQAIAAAEKRAHPQGVAAGIQNVASAVAANVDQAVDAPAAAAATSSSSAKATSSSGSSTSETLDEKLVMFNLERAVQKQNDMFAALSNILKSFNDTRMSIIQNLR